MPLTEFSVGYINLADIWVVEGMVCVTSLTGQGEQNAFDGSVYCADRP